MRHHKRGRKLGTDASHTKAMRKSLVGALFLNDRIKTVEARAKEVRSDVDRVITWAKKGDLHARRLAIAMLGDKELVREIFEKVEQGMFQDRSGGYTRILKLGNRKGDNASMVILELVTEPVGGKKKEAAKPTAKKTSARKAAKEAKAAAAETEKATTEAVEGAEEDTHEEAEAPVAEAATDEEPVEGANEPEQAPAETEQEADGKVEDATPAENPAAEEAVPVEEPVAEETAPAEQASDGSKETAEQAEDGADAKEEKPE